MQSNSDIMQTTTHLFQLHALQSCSLRFWHGFILYIRHLRSHPNLECTNCVQACSHCTHTPAAGAGECRQLAVVLRNTRCQPDASPHGPNQRGRPATAQAVNLPAAELRSDRVSTDARDMLNLAVPGILLQCCERICRKRK